MSAAKVRKDLLTILETKKVLTDELDLMYYSYDSSFLTQLKPAVPWQ